MATQLNSSTSTAHKRTPRVHTLLAIATARVALVLSPESRRFIYVAAYAENFKSDSRDARRPLRYAKMTVASPGRSRIAAARRELLRTPGEIRAYEGGDSPVAGSWRYVRPFICRKPSIPHFRALGQPEYLVYSAFSLRHVR